METFVARETLRKVHARDQDPISLPYLGNFSASSNTVSIPSRASTAAVYDPPGPPPTTKTVHCSGMDILIVDMSVQPAQAKTKRP